MPSFFLTNKTPQPQGEVLGLNRPIRSCSSSCLFSSFNSSGESLYGRRQAGSVPGSSSMTNSTGRLGGMCDTPRPMRQVSASYSSPLPCHLFVCCIFPCHHLHCIIMFSKLASVRTPLIFPFSVLSPETLAHARGASEYLFYKWPENVLRMG